MLDSPSPLRLETSGPVATLTLARPQARNALSMATLTALRRALDEVAERAEIRALLIAHDGPAFSAGHDLKEIAARRADADRGRAFFAELMAACAGVMTRIVRMPQPVIAVVEGVATAAGCQLVASCDLAVAGAQARFATPGVNIGLFCSTPMVALTRNLARKHAMEMLLTGEMIDAEHAARIGLINKATEQGGALAAARAWADLVASKSATTLKIGKRAFYEQAEMTLDQAYAHAGAVMVENMLARDAEEGIAAFVDKREPNWEHR
ncbi:MAG: enoyl-CoA hydratase [Rhizobiales bacterium]|nr:enoyl-CoA hydratase [Hyphomicrobiales bacterium]